MEVVTAMAISEDVARLWLHDGRDEYSLEVDDPTVVPEALDLYDAVEYEQDEEGIAIEIRIVGNYREEFRAAMALARHENEQGEGGSP